METLAESHQGPVATLIPAILDFMASRVEDTPMAWIAKVVIANSRAFPEIGRFYLKEVIGRGIPIFEGLIARGVENGEFRKVDPMLTVRSLIGTDAAQHHLEDGVRADRRGQARCARPRPPSRRPDAACPEAVMKRIVPILVVAALRRGPGFYWRAPLLSALGFGERGMAAISAMSKARPA